MSQEKKRKATPIFRGCPNGEMYDIVEGVLIPKVVKKPIYKSKTKIKNNGTNN